MSLGMEDGRIKDSALSASSIYNANTAAKRGRLNLVAPSSSHSGAWCVKTKDANQWIQIDLGRPTTVTKVATQGRQDYDQWVTSYAVSYSLVSPYWVYHMSHGNKKVECVKS